MTKYTGGRGHVAWELARGIENEVFLQGSLKGGPWTRERGQNEAT